jgi:hypothetical protein
MNKLAITLALLLASGVAVAQNGNNMTPPPGPVLNGEAVAHVWVDVVANVAVGVATPNVDIGEVAYGKFPAQVVFRVDANVESVKLTVVATDLYKGDDPASIFVIPVCTDAGEGALVQPTNANAMAGHGNLLAWTGGDTTLNGMNAVQSETVEFESGQNGHFSQDVMVTVKYNQIDPELPKGEYSGFVKLVVEIDP